MAEENGTLVRDDLVESLRHLDDTVRDPAIEPDPKCRRKYARHWK